MAGLKTQNDIKLSSMSFYSYSKQPIRTIHQLNTLSWIYWPNENGQKGKQRSTFTNIAIEHFYVVSIILWKCFVFWNENEYCSFLIASLYLFQDPIIRGVEFQLSVQSQPYLWAFPKPEPGFEMSCVVAFLCLIGWGE